MCDIIIIKSSSETWVGARVCFPFLRKTIPYYIGLFVDM